LVIINNHILIYIYIYLMKFKYARARLYIARQYGRQKIYSKEGYRAAKEARRA